MGNEVLVLSNKDYTSKKLIKMGCKFIPIKFDTLSKNPFKELLYFTKIIFFLYKSKSDIYINFTIKPCIYFGLANLFYNRKSITLLDGMGRAFVNKGIFYNLMLIILKISQKLTKKIILVNKDDKKFFLKHKITQNNRISLLKAPGLNVENFKFKKRKIKNNKKMIFSFISRIMEEKGITYFLESAERIKKKFKSIFIVVGKIENDKIHKLIKKYSKKKVIKYFPNQKNVKQMIIGSDCIVLPSYYREGIPRILQEANYYGRICITTNNYGCRDVIVNGYNGFICKKKSVNDLMKKIENVILMDKQKLSAMEKKAHYYIKKNYNKNDINNKLIKMIYETIKV